MKAIDFITFLEDITRETGKTYVMLRCVGPNKCTDVDKLREVYSAYKLNLPKEIYKQIFYNEFVFVEMENEDVAWDFAFENFPKNTSGDPDYFIFACVASNGTIGYANDELKHYYTIPTGTARPSAPLTEL